MPPFFRHIIGTAWTPNPEVGQERMYVCSNKQDFKAVLARAFFLETKLKI